MGCKLRSANFTATDSSNTLLLFLHCVFWKHKLHPGLWSQTLIQSDLASFKNVDTYEYYNLWTVNKKLALMRPTKTENLTSISSILCNIDSRLWVSATSRVSVWSLSCWSMLHISWAVSSKRSSNSFSLRISAFLATCYLKKQTPKTNATENKKTQSQWRKKKTQTKTKATCIKLKRNCLLPLCKCLTALKASFTQWHELACTTCVLSNGGSDHSCTSFPALSAHWAGETVFDLHKEEEMTMPFWNLVWQH